MDLRWSEELLQYHVHSPHHLSEEEVVAGLVEDALLLFIPLHRSGYTEAWLWSACGGDGAIRGSGEGGEPVAGGGGEIL